MSAMQTSHIYIYIYMINTSDSHNRPIKIKPVLMYEFLQNYVPSNIHNGCKDNNNNKVYKDLKANKAK